MNEFKITLWMRVKRMYVRAVLTILNAFRVKCSNCGLSGPIGSNGHCEFCASYFAYKDHADTVDSVRPQC